MVSELMRGHSYSDPSEGSGDDSADRVPADVGVGLAGRGEPVACRIEGCFLQDCPVDGEYVVSAAFAEDADLLAYLVEVFSAEGGDFGDAHPSIDCHDDLRAGHSPDTRVQDAANMFFGGRLGQGWWDARSSDRRYRADVDQAAVL